ncbi:primosomal replication protein N [Gallaecimonas xiamenensis]|uniref:primosomal replication protein N n=1 Tax=Gallaecimonas xiamenensis TaxID=1207039 RepID=UPI0004BCBE7B|nr:primosomal replication protein N [Gallaecimonas xiamenensis]
MQRNRVQIDGHLAKAPRRSKSPAGIPHCQFWLEHVSTQNEANMARQARLRIAVVASGTELDPLTRELQMGSAVTVTGFLVSHMGRDGLAKTVLHAQHIELLN